MVWIRLAPLALLVIAGATAIPVDYRSPSIRFVAWFVDPWDFVLNVLLFVPLGLALGGRRWWVVAAASGMLSLGMEVLQLSQVGRHAGPSDIVGNVAGGLLGWACARLRTHTLRIESGAIGLNRWVFVVCAGLLSIAPILAISAPRESHDFSNWNSTYELAVSDELTRDRAWDGTLRAWAVYDRPLPRDVIRALSDRGLPEGESPVLEDVGVEAVARWENPHPDEPTGFLKLGPEMSTVVYQRLARAGTMSLLAWFRVREMALIDHERILTFSRDPYHRNFALGQIGRALSFRLRTPTTGLNGQHPHVRSGPTLAIGQEHFVAATYDGFVSRIFVDGELSGRKNLAASAAAFPALHDASLPLVLALSGGSLAGLFIVAYGGGRRSFRGLLGCAAGLVVVGAISALGGAPAWPVHPVGPLWRIAPSVVGGLVVAMSLAVGPHANEDRDES